MKKIDFDIFLTLASIVLTLTLSFVWVYLMLGEILETIAVKEYTETIERIVFTLIGLSLSYGSIIYMVTRYGRLKRKKTTSHPTPKDLDVFFYKDNLTHPTVSVLIPTYKEELRVIEMTLLSAALQEYPHIHVTLLVDDPVSYTEQYNQDILLETLALPEKLQQEFNAIQSTIMDRVHSFHERAAQKKIHTEEEINFLIETFAVKEQWFTNRALNFIAKNHAEHFFVSEILNKGTKRMRVAQEDLQLLRENEEISVSTLDLYYKKALSTFNVNFSVFQRKKYENLSHEPNKAMNLNSYVGLMGSTWNEKEVDGRLFLEKGTEGLEIEKPDYVITLDADSILGISYTRRLVYFMELPEHKQVAVVQTPYNAFRCPFIDLEHIAGATTDIQHFVHQGFQYFDASFWVGANALIRKTALENIKEKDVERGYEIYRYIQDRTVIEDTESSIDLIVRSWRIYNYHEQLAYSATPPDFGSLIIQRRRWANGGLIIFPKLVTYLFTGKTPFLKRIMEVFVRTHYLISIALINTGVLIVILYPFDGNLHILALISVAFLYFFLYARDLVQLGYKASDLLRVYALNLLLLPINMAGTLKSIQQMITKKKIPFGRTPKVNGRTSASIGFIIASYCLTIYMLMAVGFDLYTEKYTHAIFSTINATFFVYAIVKFIGLKASYEDILLGIKGNKNR